MARILFFSCNIALHLEWMLKKVFQEFAGLKVALQGGGNKDCLLSSGVFGLRFRFGALYFKDAKVANFNPQF